VTTLTVERLGWWTSDRDARAFDATRDVAADELGGRTVWCASALPTGRASARRLRALLGEEGGAAADGLDVVADEPVTELAKRLDRLLSAPRSAGASPTRDDEDLYAQTARAAEALVGDRVAAGDVVVLHDALSAVLAEAVRELGAHAVWRLRPGAAPAGATWVFLRRHTTGLDAFVTTRGRLIAAVMPSPDAVSAKEVAGGRYSSDGWSRLLADVVHEDRREHVGGTLHARPAVTAR
jgi:hypothetical protein